MSKRISCIVCGHHLSGQVQKLPMRVSGQSRRERDRRAHAARRETSVAGKPLEGQGGRVHESELLVQVQDVMFQAL